MILKFIVLNFSFQPVNGVETKFCLKLKHLSEIFQLKNPESHKLAYLTHNLF